MAVTRIKTSSIVTGTKYDTLLAGNPTFVPVSFESIATTTTAGGTTSVTFSSIPQTYKALQLRLFIKDSYTTTNTSGNYQLTFNGVTTTTYNYSHLLGDGASAVGSGTTSQNFIYLKNIAASSGSSMTNIYGVAIVDIVDYASTTKTKTVRFFGGVDANIASTSFSVVIGTGNSSATTEITSLRLNTDLTGLAAGSVLALYGVK